MSDSSSDPAMEAAARREFERTALPLLDNLYGAAIGLTRDPAEAEDLVQDSMVRAFRFWDSFKPGTNVKAWMFTILRNTFINRYRAKKVRPDEVDFDKVEEAYERVVDKEYLREQSPASPEAQVMDGVVDQQVADAMASLPDDYRTVVIMALVEEMSYKEIAASLEVPIGTVMSRLHRGRKLLKTALSDYAAQQGIIRGEAGVPSDGENVSRGPQT